MVETGRIYKFIIYVAQMGHNNIWPLNQKPASHVWNYNGRFVSVFVKEIFGEDLTVNNFEEYLIDGSSRTILQARKCEK